MYMYKYICMYYTDEMEYSETNVDKKKKENPLLSFSHFQIIFLIL